MKLSVWAKIRGVSYPTAYRWFKQGKLPVEATQTASGTILVTPEKEDNMMMPNSLQKMNGSRNHDTLFSMLEDASRLLNVFESTHWPNNTLNNVTQNKFRTLNEENQYVVIGEIPGFTEDEIKVSVKNNVLTISGKHELQEQNDRYFSKDSAVFESSYTLPSDADLDNISAEQKNGILEIVIPKTARQIKEIPIKQLKPK